MDEIAQGLGGDHGLHTGLAGEGVGGAQRRVGGESVRAASELVAQLRQPAERITKAPHDLGRILRLGS